MNYIIFNHDGSIKNVNFADIIVQGNNLVDEIFVAVEGRSTDSYLATAYFELPNGDSNFLTATLASHSIDQSPYNGYKFLLTGAQTAFYGRVRMSIKLEGMQGETLWTYEQVLTINKSGYNPDFTMISMSQYAALLQAMGSLQEKYVVNNARFYSSLANAQADLDNLAFNQCVIIADVNATDPIPEIYFKNSESQLELLAGIGEYTFQAGTTTTQTLAPGSDATVSVSFVASGKTITMNFAFGIPKGDTGATGNGIESIEKHSTQGQVDTYRVTYTNGGYFDFDVINGTLSGHLASSAFEYDDESIDSLSYQLAAKIRSLVDADGSKVKSIMASKPTSDGGVTTYSIVWKYNVNIIPGALNIQDGEFYFENNGTLTSIDSNLEDYTFSIFHEVDGTSADDFGYIEIVDTANVESGTLTQAELVELRKPISFIRYQTGVRSYDMLISYYSARQANQTISKYFRGFMHKGSEDFDSDYAYNLSRGFITVTNLDSTTTGGWTYSLNVDAYVDKAPTENSTDLVTSGGVYDAVSALDSKISKNAQDIAALTEALIKKDLYETQEATFQGMTAVPAGAMVKAYLDGFKGNSAVVNQLIPHITQVVTVQGIQGTVAISGERVTLTCSSSQTAKLQLYKALSVAQLPMVAGHTYLQCAWVRSSKTMPIKLRVFSTLAGQTFNLTANVPQFCYYIGTAIDYAYPREVGIVGVNADDGLTTGDTIYFENMMLIDLTLAGLTSAEMADAPTAKDALKHKGMDIDSYIPYNEGTLTDSKPTKMIIYGRNLYNVANQAASSSGQFCWTTAFTKVFGGTTISVEFQASIEQITTYQYDENQVEIPNTRTTNNWVKAQTITLNSATRYVKSLLYFASSKTVNEWDAIFSKLCIHIGSDNLGYTPYVPPTEYDLTMPYLKSAGSVQDESKAGGSKVKQDDLATIKSGGFAAYGGYLVPFVYAGTKSVSENPNLLCDKYQTVNGVYANTSYTDPLPDKSITVIVNSNNLFIKDSALGSIDDLVGTLLSPKATPTDFADMISYPEIFDVYAGGSVEVVGEGCDATAKVYFYVEA